MGHRRGFDHQPCARLRRRRRRLRADEAAGGGVRLVSRRYLHGLHRLQHRRCDRWVVLGRAVRPHRRQAGRADRHRRHVGGPRRAEMAERAVAARSAVLPDRRGRLCLPVHAADGADGRVVQRAQGARDRHRHRRRRLRPGHRALSRADADHRARLARRHAGDGRSLPRHPAATDVPAAAGACRRATIGAGRGARRQSLEHAACGQPDLAWPLLRCSAASA